MHRTRIKMCGTTNVADARKAVALGVDALGFIFVHKSPRYITPQAVLEITRDIPPFVAKIGVFVNTQLREIEEIARFVGLSGIQLHGDESPLFCREAGSALPSCTVLKAVRVGNHTKSEDFSQYSDTVSGFVLDTYVKGKEGGTGLAFDWSVLPRLNIAKPCILAGGLTCENVGRALETATPYGVDVNSGVEHAPGRKNHELLQDFFAAVSAFDRGKVLSEPR